MTAPNVIGLDLSLTATGIAMADGTTGIVKCKHTGMERLRWLRDALIPAGPVDLVVIEGYSFGSRNSHAHALGELGGVVRLALHEARTSHLDVSPSTLKMYATGKGNAGKEEVTASAIRRLGFTGHDNNEADALWLRAIGLDLLGHPPVELPQTHRRALDKLTLPAGLVAA